MDRISRISVVLFVLFVLCVIIFFSFRKYTVESLTQTNNEEGVISAFRGVVYNSLREEQKEGGKGDDNKKNNLSAILNAIDESKDTPNKRTRSEDLIKKLKDLEDDYSRRRTYSYNKDSTPRIKYYREYLQDKLDTLKSTNN